MDPHVTQLLSEAQCWHLLSRLFERPDEGWHARVRALADGLEASASDIHAAASAAPDATEGHYLSTFGPSGVVSPREVAHCGQRDPGQLLADLQARYTAFGFHPLSEDPIDHLAVETDFVGYLRLKEAIARSEGDVERATITAEAAQAFMADHLRDMAEPIAGKLEPAAEPYLVCAARALARRVGPPANPSGSKVIWLEDDSLTCGETVATGSPE